MSKNMCASSKLLTLLLAILLYVQANAGILRLLPATTTTEKSIVAATDATTTTTTINLQNTEATFLPKDIDEKLLISTTTTASVNNEKDEDTTENSSKSNIALSRDEEATVKLAAMKNPNLDAEVLKIDTHKSDDAELSKLLLLSVPKTVEKSREPEENIEEPKEIAEEYTNLSTIATTTNHVDQSQATTVLPFETTTTTISTDDNTESAEESKEKSNDFKSSNESESKEDSNEAVQEMQEKTHVDNAANAALEVHGFDDYVILDESEYLEDEAHLEPYVHSIEIVPSRLEGVLLEDFVHDW